MGKKGSGILTPRFIEDWDEEYIKRWNLEEEDPEAVARYREFYAPLQKMSFEDRVDYMMDLMRQVKFDLRYIKR